MKSVFVQVIPVSQKKKCFRWLQMLSFRLLDVCVCVLISGTYLLFESCLQRAVSRIKLL